jgi:hypothetical protein
MKEEFLIEANKRFMSFIYKKKEEIATSITALWKRITFFSDYPRCRVAKRRRRQIKNGSKISASII